MSLSTETASKKNKDFTNAPARKFMFDRSFADATEVHRTPERKAVTLKPEQIDALKKESYDIGFAAGKDAGKEEQTEQLTFILTRVEQNLGALTANMAALAKEEEEQTKMLALAIVRKILPGFIAKSGTEEVEKVISEAIKEMAREPRLVVRVHEAEFDALNTRVQEIATQRAYPGKVVVVVDAAVASGDCRIEWADGGIERNTPAILNTIEQTICPTPSAS